MKMITPAEIEQLISKADKSSLNDSSKLEEMWQKQAELLRRLEPGWTEWSPRRRVEFIKDLTLHLQIECAEMLQELPYLKAWKEYGIVDESHCNYRFAKARNEFVDMLHFLLEIGIVLGFTPSELFYMYKFKNKENHERQDNGYAE